MFYKWEKETPGQLLFHQPFPEGARTYTYAHAGEEIRRLAAALIAMNLPARTRIAILSKNCAHWIMSDLAIWMAGHVSVPIYPTLSANAVRQILDHSETKVIFVGKLDDYDSQRGGIADHIQKISFPFYGINEGLLWNALIENNKPIETNPTLDRHEMATIKYTSGTTGVPKGVMISFHAIDHALPHAFNIMRTGPADRFFSYLPLSHIAERMLVELGAIYNGATIYFSESLDKFASNLSNAQPTVFLAVPRIWSKFREKILEKLPQKKLNLLLSLPIISSIVKKKIKTNLGLLKCNWALTGASPISLELLEWFKKLDITILEVYGMTENLAWATSNVSELRFGSIGKAWTNVQVRLTSEGELQTKGDATMLGYYKMPDLTKESFTSDGFLKSGDLAQTDSQGFYFITGRIKDQFKTDKGKYIAPAPIEMKLSSNADVEQVCVVGMGVPQPLALVVLSAAGKAKSKEEVTQSLTSTLELVNKDLEGYEKLHAAVIMKDDWTIPNGLMTPSLKVKRNEVEKLHLPAYPKWYSQAGNQKVVFE
jgi:long-chain acyl-CoA synthetase